jgi:RNA polymerase sigma-70 factor, ECF subfamily
LPGHGRRVHADVDAAALCDGVADRTPLTEQPADAEDLVQDTLIRVYRAIARFDGQHPRAWLLTILRNTHRNRARRRQPALLDESRADLAHTPAFGMPPPTPEQLLVDNTLGTAVARAPRETPQSFSSRPSAR